MKNLFLALFLALAPAAFANIWYVDGVHGSDNNDCKTRQTACRTIGHAISLASWGDTIGVGPATYKENLTVNISLNIIGADASTTIVDGSQSGTVFTIEAPTVLSKLTIQNGYADDNGAGIANESTLTLSMCTIAGNNSIDNGGGISNGGTLTVSMCTISGNSSGDNGGGISNFGTLMVSMCTIVENSSDDNGGGISNAGTLTVSMCTISENSSEGNGGGIYNNGTLIVRRCAITGNGGISNSGGIVNSYEATVNNSTITGNSGNVYGGGILNFDTATVQNTILARNSQGNCLNAVTSEGYNLSDDNSCNFNGPGDMNNTEPLLGTLGNNGGPTQTIPELPGSPTIDAGNPTGCTNNNGPITIDQRGYPRPGQDKQDKRCDIGAYESQTD